MIAAMLLVIQFVAADGRVAFATVTYDLEPEVCARMAAAKDGQPHAEWVQVARCVEEEPVDLFTRMGRT